jgi:hypothetical protein
MYLERVGLAWDVVRISPELTEGRDRADDPLTSDFADQVNGEGRARSSREGRPWRSLLEHRHVEGILEYP